MPTPPGASSFGEYGFPDREPPEALPSVPTPTGTPAPPDAPRPPAVDKRPADPLSSNMTSAQRSSQLAAVPPGDPLRVLVVDDDMLTRQLMER